MTMEGFKSPQNLHRIFINGIRTRITNRLLLARAKTMEPSDELMTNISKALSLNAERHYEVEEICRPVRQLQRRFEADIGIGVREYRRNLQGSTASTSRD